MKVLVICSHFPPRESPESNHALLLCENLAKADAEVHLLTSPLLPGAPTAVGFHIHAEINSWGWRGIPQIISAVRRIKPDVVLLIYVGWIYGNHPMITFAPSFLRWAGIRRPFVTQFENVMGAITPTFRARAQWRIAALLSGCREPDPRFGSLLARSDAVIFLSERHSQELSADHATMRSRATVIPAPPLLRIRAEEDGRARLDGRTRLGLAAVDHKTVILTFFGYVYPGKGVETLLEAVSILKHRLADHDELKFQLIVVGKVVPEIQDRLQALESRLELGDSVVWVGHKEGEDCSTYLRASDIAILPFDEGIRLNNSSFAVCATHGLPIITTHGEKSEMSSFHHMENSLLCPPKNAPAMADAIEKLVQSPELRRELGLGALSMAKSIFSWDAVVQSTRNVLQSTIRVES